MDRSASQQRELVFCHACENEWYRDEHDLQCPSCQSEFTEVIEEDHDPRAAAPDPGEDDIDFLNPHTASGNQPPPDISSIFQNLGGLFGGALGAAAPSGFARQQPGPPQTPPHPPHPSRPDSVDRQSEAPAPGQPRVRVWTNSGPGFSFTAQTSTYEYGSRNSPHGQGEQDEPNQPMHQADLGRMIVDLLGSIQGRGQFPGPPGGDGFHAAFTPVGAAGTRGPLGMADFMAQVMGMHGDPGDYIHSQEAFDRMVSQMMDQNQHGDAPGPATEEAIRNLPRKAADSKLLGGEKADCSICMVETNIGDEVVSLPCGHWYHPDCISMWLREHDTCAICRKGITARDGNQTAVRAPDEDPLHDHDPVSVARRQSGTRDNPIWVPESPSTARRTRPPFARQDSAGTGSQVSRSSSATTTPSGGGGRGFARAFRSMFSGSSASGGGSGSARTPPRR